MGRIKTRFVKSNGDKIFNKGKEEFTEDFNQNKEIVEKYAQISSKRMRNTVVGHVTRLAKRNAQAED